MINKKVSKKEIDMVFKKINEAKKGFIFDKNIQNCSNGIISFDFNNENNLNFIKNNVKY